METNPLHVGVGTAKRSTHPPLVLQMQTIRMPAMKNQSNRVRLRLVRLTLNCAASKVKEEMLRDFWKLT